MAEAADDVLYEDAAAQEEDVLPADSAWELGEAGEFDTDGVAFPLEVGGAEEAEQDIEGAADAIEDVESSVRAELWTEAVGLPEAAEGAEEALEEPHPAGIKRKQPLCVASPPAPEEKPFPALSQYMEQCSGKKHGSWRWQSTRYFSPSQECSDDGHVTRWAARMLCLFCLDLKHQMRDCPHARCGLCFDTGHGALECPSFQEHAVLQESLAEQYQAALPLVAGGDASPSARPSEEEEEARASGGGAAGDGKAGEDDGAAQRPAAVRCVACRTSACGRANCSLPPARLAHEEGGEEDHLAAEVRAQERAFAADDDAAAAFGRWAQHAERAPPEPAPSMEVDGDGGGEQQAPHGGVSLETAVLRLLGGGRGSENTWGDVLAGAPAAAVSAAARGLGRVRALVPGESCGSAPQVTALGWWLSQLPVPPLAANALLHGALWGVLLPVAVVVVLLESAPPDLALSDGTTPPRKSGHFALVAAYFRWREGRETNLARRFGADLFWEAVDQRVVAICKHAQSALGYDGDDAAFEEMDGELMDVRRNDGRPWTLASAVGGSEASARWSRFRAALAAAFPPRPASSRSGDWVIGTRFGDGPAQVETVVSSGYAVLFAAGELAQSDSSGLPSAEIRLDGVGGTLCGGEGALEEALAIRQQLSERVDQALETVHDAEGATPAASVMDEADVAQVLNYLRGSAGQFMTSIGTEAVGGCSGWNGSSQEASGDVGDSVLAFLGRTPEAATDKVEAGGSDLGSTGKRRKHDGFAAQASASPPCLPPPRAATGGQASAPSTGGEADVAAGLEACRVVAVEACRVVAVEADVEEGPSCANADGLGRWAVAVALASLLRVMKRNAVAGEDYDLAAGLKPAEAAAAAEAAARRAEAVKDWASERAGALERLARRKRKAVADEDYALAARLKRRAEELASTLEPPREGDLERLLAEKAEAVANEDYDRAASLRQRQLELEAAQSAFQAAAGARAAALLADGAGRAAVLQAAAAAQVQPCQTLSLGDGIWPEVQAELGRGSGDS